MYLFQSLVSFSDGMLNSVLISFSIVSERGGNGLHEPAVGVDVSVIHQIPRSAHGEAMLTLTNGISFAKMPCDHIVHVVILTQVQLQEIDLHLTVLDKHAVFHNLGGKKHKCPIQTWKGTTITRKICSAALPS